MRNIEQPYIEKKTKNIYNPAVENKNKSTLEVLRIAQEEELTRIDFVHHADPIRRNGGWVRIEPGTFIRPSNTGLQMAMIRAVNIPSLHPNTGIKSIRDCLYYTLYFPSLPDNVEAIDIIEREAARPKQLFQLLRSFIGEVAREVIIVPNYAHKT